MNINSLNGNEMIVGDNMNIPSASKMFATTRSNTINGTKMIKPISKDVFNSLIMNAGATSQMEISSGSFGGVLCAKSMKNAKSLSLVCFIINSFNGFDRSEEHTSE